MRDTGLLMDEIKQVLIQINNTLKLTLKDLKIKKIIYFNLIKSKIFLNIIFIFNKNYLLPFLF